MEIAYILHLIAMVAGLILTVIVLTRRPQTRLHYLLAVAIVLLCVEHLCAWRVLAAVDNRWLVTWQRWRLVVMSLIPAPWLLFSLAYSRGKPWEHVRRWRIPLVFSALVPALLLVFGYAALIQNVTITHASARWVFNLGRPAVVLHGVFVLVATAILMNLERTLRTSVGTMRWRVKYMVLGVGTIFAARIYTSVQALLYARVDVAFGGIGAMSLLLGAMLMLVALTRDPDLRVTLYPSRSLIGHSITVLVAGIYLIVVGSCARFIVNWGNVEAYPLVALLLFLAVIVLVAAGLSDRVRLSMRHLISRHLRRPEYDYRKVWETFTERTASTSDLGSFARAAVRAVSRTVEALSVSLWQLEDDQRHLVLSASTATPDGSGDSVSRRVEVDALALAHACRRSRPIDMNESRDSWVHQLRDATPSPFEHRGTKLCVPLVSGDDVVGVLIVSDRVRQLPFTVEEIDLLQTLGAQVAASIRMHQMAERLYANKQLEAFQMMSAFFVHDLKNTASTLGLMLQNLPKHFADPQFREDALRSIGKTTKKVNELIERLSELRRKLDICATPTDLNALILKTLDDLDAVRAQPVELELNNIPVVAADANQLQKVLTNLLVNASEALGEGGKVWVRTDAHEGIVSIQVKDNGHGMSSRYMTESLFKPFQSTKKNGMGIGLYQSRMIVEAHGGRIDVQSEEGQGSVFVVSLPLKEE